MGVSNSRSLCVDGGNRIGYHVYNDAFARNLAVLLSDPILKEPGRIAHL